MGLPSLLFFFSKIKKKKIARQQDKNPASQAQYGSQGVLDEKPSQDKTQK
jgi:hypothetical protein